MTDATRSVFRVMSQHVDRGQIEMVREALPEEVRRPWTEHFFDEAPGQQRRSATG